MAQIKVVQGNSFWLQIDVTKKVIGGDATQALDLTNLVDRVVKLVNIGSITLQSYLDSTTTGRMFVYVPSNVALGNYKLEVTGKYNGESIRSSEMNMVAIVDHNSQASAPTGTHEGEDSYAVDMSIALVNAIAMDDEPTEGSNNILSSGAVYTALQGKQATGDYATKAEVSDEATARSNADTALQSAIDGKQDAGSYATETELEAEITARKTADTNLQVAIDGKQDSGDYATNTALSTKADKTYVDTELAKKQATGDYATKDDVNAEKTARVASEATLQTAINAKQNAGDYATNTALQTAKGALQTAIDGKQDAGDYALKAYVDTSVTNAKNVLQTAIDKKQDSGDYATASDMTAEATARTNADNVLQANIDKKQDAGDYATKADVNTEAINRQNADTTLQTNIDKKQDKGDYATNSSLTTAKNALQAEIDTKQAKGDYALATALEYETTQRESADETLQTNIDAVDEKATTALSKVADAETSASNAEASAKSAQASATNAQTSASNAETSASNADAKLEELKVAIQALPDGQAVSAQVAEHTTEIATINASLATKAEEAEVTELAQQVANVHPATSEDGFYVVDNDANVGMQYIGDGLDAAKVSEHFVEVLKSAGVAGEGIALTTMAETNEDGFAFVDENLNIGVLVDEDGIHAKNILEYEIVES